jgi:hypothetical protein
LINWNKDLTDVFLLSIESLTVEKSHMASGGASIHPNLPPDPPFLVQIERSGEPP